MSDASKTTIQWQPIETAPDGVVLLSNGGDGIHTGFRRNGKWRSVLSGSGFEIVVEWQPELWAPMP